MNTPSSEFDPLIRSARELRRRMREDPHRPRYHLIPLDGFWNDANGTMYWKGRYHVFYLGRAPSPEPVEDPEEDWLPVLEHSSSSDLVHWVHHPPAIEPAFDGSTPRGIYSGDAIENAPVPTMIYHVPEQGTCISTCEDDELIHWTPSSSNPVIPEVEGQEYRVFDPCAWYDNGVYYALIGNKNTHPGYEGDATSLFTSDDLENWEYRGPFYKSSREWTSEVEDCACPDFFPMGDRHMLLMHGHRPYAGIAHYYLGRYEGDRFYPEMHGRMNWPGGQLSGPETLLDGKGRRIFFGWIREARLWEGHGWASVMTLPRVLSLFEDGSLRIEPAVELETLRANHRHLEDIRLFPDSEATINDVWGDCLELLVEIEGRGATSYGVKVRCSPDGEEKTVIECQTANECLRIDLARSTLDEDVTYSASGQRDGALVTDSQEAPFRLADNERLRLRIFLDRSVLEVFANDRQCVTQRIYPMREDSLGVALFAKGGEAVVRTLDAWDMMPVQ